MEQKKILQAEPQSNTKNKQYQNYRPRMVSDINKHKTWAKLFKTNNVVSSCIVKTLIIKYGKYTNIFVEKMWVALQSYSQFFSKIPVN